MRSAEFYLSKMLAIFRGDGEEGERGSSSPQNQGTPAHIEATAGWFGVSE